MGRINAVDPDFGPNGTVTYKSQVYNEFFDVKQNGNALNVKFVL